MRAEVVSVGTELLLGQTVDTNAAEIGRALATVGIDHYHRQTVGDNLARLTEAIRLALSRSDVVVTVGGLGPTQDDLTRDGIAAAAQAGLVRDPRQERHLRALFKARNLVMTDSQLRQCLRPAGAEPLDNPNGTAPALWFPFGDKLVVALPGPPNELKPILRSQVIPRLAGLVPGGALHSRTFRVVGFGEAHAESLLSDLLQDRPYSLAPYAKVGEVHFRASVKAASPADADAVLDSAEAEVRAALGRAVYALDEVTLEETLLSLMRARGLSLGVAESCTGGGLGHRLTIPEGASDVFAGGVLTYSNALKAALLGVPAWVLESPEHGSVSEECARHMALGCRDRLGVDVALSVTGVAGAAPFAENGVKKPSGLVVVGIATPDGTTAIRFQWGGSRASVRARAAQAAMTTLYDWLVPS